MKRNGSRKGRAWRGDETVITSWWGSNEVTFMEPLVTDTTGSGSTLSSELVSTLEAVGLLKHNGGGCCVDVGCCVGN